MAFNLLDFFKGFFLNRYQMSAGLKKSPFFFLVKISPWGTIRGNDHNDAVPWY